ncbi:DNA gyrase inhibitor YacG [Acetobacter sp. DsW_059]|uniref:DNA gyrase inhibitor YacG n=1 Tax=Acetobacter sp. DsW_059 TaxID=1670661 RepID=UPI000A397AB7|nr:DNA gyrase inhibitor YacG [Acetobacter sp. DsW_059]
MTKTATCPICKAPANHETRPFCSRRCADIDLGRWFNGTYSIPVPAEPSEKNKEN